MAAAIWFTRVREAEISGDLCHRPLVVRGQEIEQGEQAGFEIGIKSGIPAITVSDLTYVAPRMPARTGRSFPVMHHSNRKSRGPGRRASAVPERLK
jgi:hypothetical protein